jgi:riboflavin kinase/FMN adenylyltransferase
LTRSSSARIIARAMGEARQAVAARSCVVPGNHDGVHRGHRALIDEASAYARPRGLRVVALTFDPHPLHVLAPERAPARLTSIARRIELLRGAGCDEVHVATFDSAFAAQSPETFADVVLVDTLHARAIVLGPDFRFGAKRAGDLALLAALGEARDFEVVPLAPLCADGAPISSSRIRAALGDGDVHTAARLLGRVHDVDGEVVLGHQRGRTLGFPTANLGPSAVLLPADGVYAVVARVLSDGAASRVLGGVANLGVRPTVGAGRSVEVHLFDFDGDLYGAQLRVGFVARLREERRFDGLAALTAQIAQDAADARVQLVSREQELDRWL